MMGLILKDMLNLKSYAKMLLLFGAIFGFFSFVTDDSSTLDVMFAMICGMLVLTTMSYDDLAKWDRYALTMPITRKEIVRSKYIDAMIFSAAGFIVVTVVTFVICMIKGTSYSGTDLLTSVVLFFVAILLNCIMIPMLYKFGTEKARIIMILCALLPTGIILLVANMLKGAGIPMPSEQAVINFLYCLPVLLVAIIIVSYNCSQRIYAKKEF